MSTWGGTPSRTSAFTTRTRAMVRTDGMGFERRETGEKHLPSAHFKFTHRTPPSCRISPLGQDPQEHLCHYRTHTAQGHTEPGLPRHQVGLQMRHHLRTSQFYSHVMSHVHFFSSCSNYAVQAHNPLKRYVEHAILPRPNEPKARPPHPVSASPTNQSHSNGPRPMWRGSWQCSKMQKTRMPSESC
jgi:hypothetical protein